MQFCSFASAWSEGLYAWPVPVHVLLTQPSSDGTNHIIIWLKLSSADRIFYGSEEVKSKGAEQGL
jgi:hypothetical protein